MGRSFHQYETVNENVLESDFLAFCDGITSLRSLTDCDVGYFELVEDETGNPARRALQ